MAATFAPDREPQKSAGLPADEPGIYRAGTLVYTKASLAILFFWLLWGDFCYVLMEAVGPSVIPFKFQALNASNKEIGLIMGSIPAFLYMIMNPIVSFRSDRFRSRWGRRIPFIFFTIPPLVLCLIGLAFADKLGFWLHSHLGAAVAHVSPNEFAIWTIGALLVAFTFFNTFLTSIFWYLFNDVVPERFLARFMSWFRTISLFSGALYNICIFRYAGTHGTEILVGVSILYFFGFGLMCLFVKEGEYPPAPAYVGGESGLIAAVKTYAVECHFTPLYWYQWMGTFFGTLGGCAGAIGSGWLNAFGIFYYQAVGLTQGETGEVYSVIGFVVAALVLVSGWLADRYHPIRVALAGAALTLWVVYPVCLIWLVWHPSHRVAYWASMAIGVFLMAPAIALVGVYDPPLFMRLFPRSRYGQFCSTNAIWRSVAGIIGGFSAGAFLDVMAHSLGKERAYLCAPLWQLIFGIPGFYFFLKLYQTWKKLGGDNAYVAPVLDAPPSSASEVKIADFRP
jgi:maltose/moltooligosaccharide transporter